MRKRNKQILSSIIVIISIMSFICSLTFAQNKNLCKLCGVSFNELELFCKAKDPIKFDEGKDLILNTIEKPENQEIIDFLSKRNLNLDLENSVMIKSTKDGIILIPILGNIYQPIIPFTYDNVKKIKVMKFLVLTIKDNLSFLIEIFVSDSNKKPTKMRIISPLGFGIKIDIQSGKISDFKHHLEVVKGRPPKVTWECAKCVIQECLIESSWCSWTMTLLISCSDCWTGVGCGDCLVSIAQTLYCGLISCHECDEVCGVPTLTLNFDAAGVQGETSVYVNGNVVGNLLLNDDVPGYLTNTFEFSSNLLHEGINEIYIPAPYSSFNDVYDDIQLTNFLLKTSNDEIIFKDEGVYHIGDQTIAEIEEYYENGNWTDPNPPEFWTELIGSSLTITFEYYPDRARTVKPSVKGNRLKIFQYTRGKRCQ